MLSDSSVICAYLDEAYPGHPLLPADPTDRARARWLEEYADTRLGDIFIWGLFYQKIVHPLVWGEPGDQQRGSRRRWREDIPAALDYLEGELPADGWLFGEIGLADIAIASFFRNAFYAGFEIDAARWPRTASLRRIAHSRTTLSPRPCRSRTSSAASTSRAGGRHCSTPARRSPPKRSASPPRARGRCGFSSPPYSPRIGSTLRIGPARRRRCANGRLGIPHSAFRDRRGDGDGLRYLDCIGAGFRRTR